MADTTTFSQILTRGTQSALESTSIVDGILRYTTDTGRLYLDLAETGATPRRLRISDIEDSYKEEEIFAILAPLPKIYVASDTHRAYVNSGLEWVDLAAVKLSAVASKDADQPLWFSETTAEQPSYSADVTYNSSSKILKTPNMTVSDSINVKDLTITNSATVPSLTVTDNISAPNISADANISGSTLTVTDTISGADISASKTVNINGLTISDTSEQVVSGPLMAGENGTSNVIHTVNFSFS